MYIDVRECPPHVRAALEALGYGARDIALEPAETFSPQSEGGKGSRGFCAIVNLATGEREILRGSWGGENPFTRSHVDGSQESHPMPANACVIKGQTGYPRTFARILVHPDALPRLLPAGAGRLVDMDAAELVADGARRLVGVLDCIAAAGTTAELESLTGSRSGTWAQTHAPAAWDAALGEGRH